MLLVPHSDHFASGCNPSDSVTQCIIEPQLQIHMQCIRLNGTTPYTAQELSISFKREVNFQVSRGESIKSGKLSHYLKIVIQNHLPNCREFTNFHFITRHRQQFAGYSIGHGNHQKRPPAPRPLAVYVDRCQPNNELRRRFADIVLVPGHVTGVARQEHGWLTA